MSDKTIIITAGGIGKRMGGNLPKQFLNIAGKPILFHTINCFYNFDNNAQILVTLPANWKSYWNELCEKHDFTIPHIVVSGGEERYHSIQLALVQATGKYIAVHDGVRPLVSLDTITRSFDSASEFGTGIPVLPIKDSLRDVTNSTSVAVNRTNYRIVQTPQVFERELLLNAYSRPFHSGITDDASLVEESGVSVHLVEGNEENIKITTQLDLNFCELLVGLKNQ